MKGAHETKAAAAPTAQPRASTRSSHLLGHPGGSDQNLPQAGHAANHHPQGPAGINEEEKTLQSLPRPWSSHMSPS